MSRIQLRIESEGAFSLNTIYDIFNIPEGAEFFVYSENKEMILGAFTNSNHKPHGGFSTAPIKGDKIIFEYIVFHFKTGSEILMGIGSVFSILLRKGKTTKKCKK